MQTPLLNKSNIARLMTMKLAKGFTDETGQPINGIKSVDQNGTEVTVEFSNGQRVRFTGEFISSN